MAAKTGTASANPTSSATAAAAEDLVDDYGNPIQAQAVDAGAGDLVDDFGNPISAAPAAPSAMSMDSFLPPPPQPEFEGTIANFLAGATKGGLSSIYGLGKIAHGAATGDFGAFDDPNSRDEFAQSVTGGALGGKPQLESLDPRGGSQTVGMIGEQIAESFLPAGAVSRGVKMAGQYGRGAKLAAAIFGEGASGAATTYAQTGGDVDASLLSGGVSGAVAGALGLKGALSAAKQATSDLVPLAQEFGIPLTTAEKTQKLLHQLREGFLRNATTGGRRFLEFDVTRNKQLAEAAEKIVDISSALDPATAGQFVQEGIKKFEKIVRSDYGAITEDLLERNADLVIESDGALKETAQRLYDSLNVEYAPSIGDIDGIGKAKAILQDFIEITEKPAAAAGHHGKPAVNVDDMLANTLGYDVAKEAPKKKVLTFPEARKLRTLLYNIADSSDTTIGQGALKQLNMQLDEEIMAALPEADAKLFRAASAQYREQMKIVETTAIKSMKKAGYPETIVDTLLARGAETRATELRKILDKSDMEKLRAAIWARVMDTTDERGVFMGTKLREIMDKLSPGAKEAIFDDPALVAKVERFTQLADELAIPSSSLEKLKTGKFMQMAGQFAPRAMVGAGLGVGANMLLNRGTSGEWAFWGTTTSIALVSPTVMAKMLTRPEVVNDLTMALKTPAGTSAAQKLAARISAYITRAQSETSTGDGSTAQVTTEITPANAAGASSAPLESDAEWMAKHPEMYPPAPPAP
jgi:hypothetical protein